MADKKKDDKKEKEDEKEEKSSGKEDKDAKGEEGKEGAPAEGEAAAEGGKKKSKKMIIIIGAVGAVVLIGIIVGVLFMTGIIGGKKAEPAAAAEAGKSDSAHKEEGAGDKKEAAQGKDGKGEAVFFDLGEMIVNLNTDGKRQTFLKLVVQLELESPEDKKAIENLKPRIVDNFQTYMRELRVDDLRGSAGLYRLREELLFRVTEAVHPIKIRDVLFQQMLVQ